ncbi:MAG: glycosyltransferase [Clostridia bacterium]|nr:glycosyltransferase [Clostridia bacterium]
MPKVSIVVPVYNLENYIEHALKSITEQTLKDIEIIVVNDGSTDRSLEIINRFAAADKRIMVVTKENGGPDSARNMGLDMASGDWIIFFDGDDYMEPDAIQKMYNASGDCDAVVCNMHREFASHSEGALFNLPSNEQVNAPDRIAKYFLGLIDMGESTDNKLYRRAFLLSTEVKFEKREEIFAEDSYFFAKILKTMGKISIVNEQLVVYVQRENSETNSVKADLAPRCQKFMENISEWYGHKYDFEMKTRAFRFFYDIIYNDVNSGYNAFKHAVSNEYFRKAIKGMNKCTLTRKQKLIVKLLPHPVILYSIIRKRGRNEGKPKNELPEDIITKQTRELAENINLLDSQHMLQYVANTIFVRSFKKNFKKIISLTMAVFIIMLAVNLVILSKEQTMILRCNYSEAAKGLYPDGTWFDIFEAKSKEVLGDVIDKYNVSNMSVRELQDRIAVFALNDSNIISRAVNATADGKDFYYITNEYSVTYNQKDKFAKNEAFDMLHYISEAYSDMFFTNYTEKNSVLKFSRDEIDLEDLEYVEIGEWFQRELESIQQFITARANENGSYRASCTDQTFTNIQKMIQNFKNNTLEEYKGFVSQSGLAKNKIAYTNKLNYKIDTLLKQKKKQQLAHDFRVTAIQRYEPYITGVAFIPSIDEDNHFYMNRTMTGIDYLTNDAYKAGTLAENYEAKICDLEKIKSNINDRFLEGAEYDRIKNSADEMIVKMCDQLEMISKIAIETDNEYINSKTMSYLEFIIPEKTLWNLFSPMYALSVALLMCIAVTVFMWFETIIRVKLAMIKRGEKGGAEK